MLVIRVHQIINIVQIVSFKTNPSTIDLEKMRRFELTKYIFY